MRRNVGICILMFFHVLSASAVFATQQASTLLFDVRMSPPNAYDYAMPAQRDSISLAVFRDGGQFRLHWVAPPLFSCLQFTVERAWSSGYEIPDDARWFELGVVPGFCNVFESVPYTYSDRSSTSIQDGSVRYRIAVQMLQGELLYFYTDVVQLKMPERLDILKLYPEPSSQTATVTFTIATPSAVTVRVFNSSGALVSTIPAQQTSPGLHSRTVDVSALPSGVYALEITTSEARELRTLRVLR